jgi:LmbE family N-acetylglucosaminyl deacetylase
VDALVLVAHADDETLGAGGTIQKLIRGGWKVNVVLLSDGLLETRAKGIDNRPSAIAACRHLGVGEPQFCGFADQKFDEVPIADLANSVFSLGHQPDLIITNAETDLNLDHRITCQVAKIVGRPKKKPVSILACEIPNTSFWNGQPFPANFYVDITQEIDRKIAAFAKYENEIQPFPHPWSEKGLRLLAEYHGMQSGFRYAEAFSIIRAYEGRLP